MHMVIDYNTIGTGGCTGVPTRLHAKIHGPCGPEFAILEWDAVQPEQLDGKSFRVQADVRVNGTPGMAAFTMQGARLLGAFSENGDIIIKSVRIGQSPGMTGFEISGTPMASSRDHSGSQQSMCQYFNRNGLFVETSVDPGGGIHAIWFDGDVGHGAIDSFLSRHKKPCFGVFADAMKPRKATDTHACYGLAYLYAGTDFLEKDLAAWLSDDKAARQGC